MFKKIESERSNADKINIVENLKDEKRISRLALIWYAVNEVAQNSTSHGIPNVFRTNLTILKIVWFVFFMISCGGCAYLLYRSITSFLLYEVVTTIKVINEMPMPFPAISICQILIIFSL